MGPLRVQNVGLSRLKGGSVLHQSNRYSRIMFVFFSGVLLGVAGCGSKELSRSKAGTMISSCSDFSQADLPTPLIVDFKLPEREALRSCPLCEVALSLGWVTKSEGSAKNFLGQPFHFVSYSLTPRGQEEAKMWGQREQWHTGGAYNVPLTKRELVDVTGIAINGPTTAQVNFTWNRKFLNPAFAHAYGEDSNEHSGLALQEGQSDFKLYDDGWRVDEIMNMRVHCR